MLYDNQQHSKGNKEASLSPVVEFCSTLGTDCPRWSFQLSSLAFTPFAIQFTQAEGSMALYLLLNVIRDYLHEHSGSLASA